MPKGRACRAAAHPDRARRPCSSRDTYRFPLEPRIAPRSRIACGRDTRPASVLRSAQAFLRDVAGNAVSHLDRDPAALDLIFAEKPSLAGRKTRQGDGERQQVEELPVLLLQVGRWGCWIGHGLPPGVFCKGGAPDGCRLVKAPGSGRTGDPGSGERRPTAMPSIPLSTLYDTSAPDSPRARTLTGSQGQKKCS